MGGTLSTLRGLEDTHSGDSGHQSEWSHAPAGSLPTAGTSPAAANPASALSGLRVLPEAPSICPIETVAWQGSFCSPQREVSRSAGSCPSAEACDVGLSRTGCPGSLLPARTRWPLAEGILPSHGLRISDLWTVTAHVTPQSTYVLRRRRAPFSAGWASWTGPGAA